MLGILTLGILAGDLSQFECTSLIMLGVSTRETKSDRGCVWKTVATRILEFVLQGS